MAERRGSDNGHSNGSSNNGNGARERRKRRVRFNGSPAIIPPTLVNYVHTAQPATPTPIPRRKVHALVRLYRHKRTLDLYAKLGYQPTAKVYARWRVRVVRVANVLDSE